MKGEVLGGVGLQMSRDDNVVTAIDDVEAGAVIPYDGGEVGVEEAVPFGHKIALVELAPGDEVHKYGEVIGRATERIEPGQWVHTHNCRSTRGRGDIADGEEEVA
jgi:altronate dehydratase small subunit